MPIAQAFNASVAYYDEWIKKALPGYDDIFSAALALMPFDRETPLRILDLGAGTGLFSAHVLQKFPRAHFTLYDVADQMLAGARARFQAYPEQFEYILGDYRTLTVTSEFDLVISSLSIHHLSDLEKRALFNALPARLRPAGRLVNVDQIRAETPYLRELYWARWLSQVTQSGASAEQIRESRERRLAYDQEASLADQLRWLQEAGFTDVDCVYKNFFVGVFLGIKPDAV
jgi:tRNA (cmo5U34)-methyltransferase